MSTLNLKNDNYNLLATNGLDPLVDEDKRSELEESARVKEGVKDAAVNAIHTVVSGEANTFEAVFPLSSSVVPDEYKTPIQQVDDIIPSKPVEMKMGTRQRITQEFKPLNASYESTLLNTNAIEIKTVISQGAWVNPRKSYLKFDIETSANCSTGIGSLANCIRETHFTAKDGTRLNTRDINAWSVIKDFWIKKTDYNDPTLSIGGQGKGYRHTMTAGTVVSGVTIPLNDLFPIFDTDEMISPKLLDGSVMRFELEKMDRVFTGVLGAFSAGMSYTISNVSTVMECHYPYPGTLKKWQSRTSHSFTDIQTENHTLTGGGNIYLFDETPKMKYVICKKSPILGTVVTDYWTTDMFDMNVGDKTTAYKFKWGINVFPEYKLSLTEHALNNLRIRPADAGILQNNNQYYIETLHLGRTDDNETYPIDEKTQIEYKYTPFTAPETLQFTFFKLSEQTLTLKL